MGKRILAAVAALCILMSTATMGLAAPGIAPLWTNVSNTTTSITFSGSSAVCSVGIVGKAGTTSISATYTLEIKGSGGYSSVGSWRESSSKQILTSSQTYSVKPGQTYRLNVTASATASGGTENIEFTSADYTCP
ncbi:hypothetical protein FACS18949_18430 [Clostridia bacterium]|nr:hypothetical protein FACS189425_01110 [Clostridia bacterium]GHV38180.1 hypothetical protein FACS18949_18430 [Clostridia bacterium]